MKRILCYGDSNTYGYNADTGERFPKSIRWTGLLQKLLSDEFEIIEEGLGGRTTVWEDRALGLISGNEYLTPCIYSHQPIDMIIIMLGTNDLKHMFAASPFDVYWGMERIIKTVKNSESRIFGAAPKIFIISPPLISKELSDDFKFMFEKAPQKSRYLSNYYKELSEEYSTLFLDAADIVEPCETDGVHLDEENHKKLARAVFEMLIEYY